MGNTSEISKEAILRLIEEEAKVNIRVFNILAANAKTFDQYCDLMNRTEDVGRLELLDAVIGISSHSSDKSEARKIKELPAMIRSKIRKLKDLTPESKWS